jgi:chromate reductase, NAD(P)H dehydrogenase (quinone)
VSVLLTVSGSLRRGSSNTALLEAAALVAPPDFIVTPYTELAELPAFNPDIEEGKAGLPLAVVRWRAALASADAVLFSSPEYAHGIPGALKNALDWAVGGSEMIDKPIGVLSASAASGFAHPQLVEVLTTMSARVVQGATLVIDIPRRGATAASLAADRAIASVLAAAVVALTRRAPSDQT